MKIAFKIPILILIVICIVTTGVITFYILRAPDSTDKNTLRKPANNIEGNIVKESDYGFITDLSDKTFVYPVSNARDPFQRLTASGNAYSPPKPATGQLSITLEGVIWNEKNPIAIITDSQDKSHLVSIGEKISEATIVDIKPRSITIETDGKKQELILWPEKL